MSQNDIPEWIDEAALAAPVAQLLQVDVAAIERWTGKQVLSGAGDQLGVWRVSGVATGADCEQPWSIFLKAWGPADEGSLPVQWNWPHREAATYRSGILETLPAGITAPRLLGEVIRPDGTLWLWLEGVAGASEAAWPIERYARAARHLGKWNGAYLTEHPLPDDDWLSRNWLRHWVHAGEPGMATLLDSREHPTIRRVFPHGSIEAFSQLWDRQQECLTTLEALPKTFAHLDAFRRNLFFRDRPAGGEEVVAIDWGYCGIAAIGEELAPLVVASIFFMEFPGEQFRQLEHMVLDGYINGLRDAGWDGDADLVWKGYASAAVLRYGVGSHRILLPWLMKEEGHNRLALATGRPFNEVIRQLNQVHARLAEMSLEVCRSM